MNTNFHSEISYDSEDMKLKKLALDEMDEDCIVQTWYRFLHVIGNPNDLTLPNVSGRVNVVLICLRVRHQ